MRKSFGAFVKVPLRFQYSCGTPSLSVLVSDTTYMHKLLLHFLGVLCCPTSSGSLFTYVRSTAPSAACVATLFAGEQPAGSNFD
jgi:hypothetical protein